MLDLTVIVPSHNHSHYLPNCLQNIYSQSLSPREVIVIEDGSQDFSLQLLQELKTTYPNLKIIQNSTRLGIHASVNSAIREAKGKYLVFCAADDLLLPGFFERSHASFLRYPKAALCFGDPTIFFQENHHIVTQLLPTTKPLYILPEEFPLFLKNHLGAISSYGTIYLKELVEKFGGYKESLKCLADVFLCYQIAFQYPVVYIPQAFASQRIDPLTYSQKMRRNFPMRLKLYSWFLREITSPKNAEFKEKAKESRLLGIGGYFAIVFLLLTPRYWLWLPGTFCNVLARKYKYFRIKEKLILRIKS